MLQRRSFVAALIGVLVAPSIPAVEAAEIVRKITYPVPIAIEELSYTWLTIGMSKDDLKKLILPISGFSVEDPEHNVFAFGRKGMDAQLINFGVVTRPDKRNMHKELIDLVLNPSNPVLVQVHVGKEDDFEKAHPILELTNVYPTSLSTDFTRDDTWQHSLGMVKAQLLG